MGKGYQSLHRSAMYTEHNWVSLGLGTGDTWHHQALTEFNSSDTELYQEFSFVDTGGTELAVLNWWY